MVKPCLLLLAGGLAAQHITHSLASDYVSLLLVASLCLLLPRRSRPAATFLLGVALFLQAGQDIVERRLDPGYAGDSMLARVRVADFPKAAGDSVVMVVTPVGDQRIPPRVRVSWFGPPVKPAIGEVWELELRLRQPRGSFNPGVFDYETWLFREKYHATGYVVGGKRNRLLSSGSESQLDAFRTRFVGHARAATESENVAAVLAAIGVGARHLISREQWDGFAISGTSHLMAISGLHIGLAALAAFVLAYAALGWICRRGNAFVAAILLGMALAVAYAIISGFGVPARRAAIMLSVAALTVARRRQVAAPAVVALAAASVFVTDPVATLAPGFHLSFAAVVLLLWLAQRKDFVPRKQRRIDAPRQLLVMQIFLMFGLLPLTALIFQRFAIVATPVNFFAVPVFSFITVPLTLAGLVLGEFSEPAAVVLLRAAAHTIVGLEWFITKMIELPFADTTLAEVSGIAWLFVCLPFAWVLLPRGWPGRSVAMLGVVAILSWKPASPPADCFDAWVLDVGQGLAVAVQTHDKVLLYDTGMAWRSGSSAAEQLILPFLRSRRIDRIDWVVVSHADLDHSGGMSVLRENLDIGRVLAGEPMPDRGEVRCEGGQGWWSGAVRFDVLHPSGPGEGNASSCVLRVSTGPHSLLLTGDIESASERELIQSRSPLAADVVIVPHHGSLTSSTVPFIDSVHPGYAIVSAGYANRWGFPKALVVDRWAAVGAEVLSTATSGAVGFRVCAADGVVALNTERQHQRRFWHAGT